jgi:coproporphyrinogen III oxidase-like Fe-S oxidoreductase
MERVTNYFRDYLWNRHRIVYIGIMFCNHILGFTIFNKGLNKTNVNKEIESLKQRVELLEREIANK